MTNAIQNAGAREKALQTLIDFANSFRTQVAYRRGIAGEAVPGVTRRIYVELGGAGGDIAEARFDQFQPVAGTGVFLTRARILGAGEWLVLGQASGEDLPCA